MNSANRVAQRWMSKVSLDYKTWKRQNVTLRGMSNIHADNGVWGSFGKGLYTVPLSNRAMARQYGDVYFVVNAIPQRPKIVQGLNAAELLRQDLAEEFCKKHGEPLSMRFFDANTTMDVEMLARGYDGLIIKGREMVNYTPKNVQYFRTEGELMQYFNSNVR
jgi:hypothetical protein